MRIKRLFSKLNLKNDGKLSFFFVGTGSAFSKNNFQNNLLIIKGDDHVLVDCGGLCPYALSKYGSKISSISNFLITHSHADHIGGLEEAALMGRYVTKKLPNVIITEEYKNYLWNYSLKGGCGCAENLNGNQLQFEDYFVPVVPEQIEGAPRPFYETNCGSINIKLYRTIHLPEKTDDWSKIFYSYGILVDDRILFPGDTCFDKPLLDWMLKDYNIEWIFHDCQFFSGGVHASYDELKTLPADVKKKIFLCHYNDSYKKYKPKKDGFAGFVKRAHYYIFD